MSETVYPDFADTEAIRKEQLRDVEHSEECRCVIDRDNRDRADFIAATQRLSMTKLIQELPWKNCTVVEFHESGTIKSIEFGRLETINNRHYDA